MSEAENRVWVWLLMTVMLSVAALGFALFGLDNNSRRSPGEPLTWSSDFGIMRARLTAVMFGAFAACTGLGTIVAVIAWLT